MFLLIGGASALSAACGLNFSTGIEAKSAWTRSYKVNEGATLELREPNGRINVEAIDGNEIQVVATRIAKGKTEEEAKAAAEKIEIKENASADRVELDSTGGTGGMGLTFGPEHRVDYDVKVPRSLSLTIKTTNGAIDVKAVTGLVKIEATNGEVTASGLERGIDVDAVNGRVVVDMAKVGPDGVRCKTVNGEIIVTIPKDAKATVAARVTNGVVEVENLPIDSSKDGSHRRLDATLGGGGPDVRLDTTNGMIKLVGR